MGTGNFRVCSSRIEQVAMVMPGLFWGFFPPLFWFGFFFFSLLSLLLFGVEQKELAGCWEDLLAPK